MSGIMHDVLLSQPRYGIEQVAHICGVRLPIRILPEETKEFFEEIKRLYDTAEQIGDGLVIIEDKEKFDSKVYVNFSLASARYVSLSCVPNEYIPEGETVIDTITRYSSLGKRLKRYWIEKEGMNEEDAQKRLELITPKAVEKFKILPDSRSTHSYIH